MENASHTDEAIAGRYGNRFTTEKAPAKRFPDVALGMGAATARGVRTTVEGTQAPLLAGSGNDSLSP